MKLFFGIIACLISINAVSQTQKTTFENGKYEEGKLENGLKEGIWNRYFKNGKIERVENYRNGKLTGEWKDFFPNGEPAIYAKFNDTLLIEFVDFDMNKDTKKSVKSKIIFSNSGLPHSYFDLFLNCLENHNEKLQKEITSEIRSEESLMIGKRINGQITEKEYKIFYQTKSPDAIKYRIDSIYSNEIYNIFLLSEATCSLIFCDNKGQYQKEYKFENGEEKSFILREFYSSKYNAPYSEVIVANNQVIKKDKILSENSYETIIYHIGTSLIQSKGKISNGSKEGPWEFYDSSGNLIEKAGYKKGQRIEK